MRYGCQEALSYESTETIHLLDDVKSSNYRHYGSLYIGVAPARYRLGEKFTIHVAGRNEPEDEEAQHNHNLLLQKG